MASFAQAKLIHRLDLIAFFVVAGICNDPGRGMMAIGHCYDGCRQSR